MNSLNSHAIALRIGQASSFLLLLSLSPSATAQMASIPAVFSRSDVLQAAAPAALPWLRLPAPTDVRDAGSILGQVEPAVMTLRDEPSPEMAAAALPRSLVIQSTGAIEADLNRFRALLGDPNNGATPGQQAAGRREINWDGVPAALTNVPDFPAAFFNTNSPRGLVYDDVSRGLQVSNLAFTDINPTYGAEFSPFSGTKMFAPRGRNESDVQFLVAGSANKALVRGFGVVFLDVDTLGSTGIELIGEDGEILGRVLAPVRSDARGASFIGVVFRDPLISRARIVAGNGRLAPDVNDISQGGRVDLVAMDDFVYGEPIASGN